MSDIVPPAPSGGGGGCWKWGALSCGIGCALVVVVFAVLVIVMWPRIKTAFGAASRMAQDVSALQYEMGRVNDALHRYHQKTGKYPDKLDALAPKYLTKADLHFSHDPSGPEFTYYKPRQNAQPTDVVLEYKLVTQQPGNVRTEMAVRMRLNGQVATEFATHAERELSPEAAPAGRPAK
ncbi:MAG: hypothetical protein ACP5VE_07060 [Chthonomonadales bacterium]